MRNDRLRRLEERLLSIPDRRDPVFLETVLAADFVEVGASGRTYDRASMIAALVKEASPPAAWSIDTWSVRDVGDAAALVRYRLTVRRPGDLVSVSERTSLWCRDGDDWRILFHQGTPVPSPA